MVTHLFIEYGEYDLYIVIYDNINHLLSEFKNINYVSFDNDDYEESAKGYVAHLDLNKFVLALKKGYNDSDLIHEIFHLTSKMMRGMGIELNDNTEESYARYNDMLYRIITKQLKISTI